MKRTPTGTPVGVDDPYAIAGICDHLTDDGRCRFALERAGDDPEFADARRSDDYQCHVGEAGNWQACPKYRWTTDGKQCIRCGLEERRLAGESVRPLIEEHHLSYGGSNPGSRAGDADRATDGTSHELTVGLCRWCHAKVHGSFARIDDDVNPDPEAIAERETRRGRELEELSFESAKERYRNGWDDSEDPDGSEDRTSDGEDA
ncbi:Uncharacterized protein AArcCO_0453 [Halalkaliarchaeum sp. AArc-CO]|uniref:DUF7097 family protein n=1 Tax=unclassified Halalkaliarchaeum TaxID=2678344 RepID=UPI00217D73CE|nr:MULTISPECIES: hypothetical protein [unclassified Halalkaliarchaeum]MDR5673536.1 hypothetical protein [Halalkaliarchaeum sp. AArc-GB]UWG49777.1 Uncharacterized protein AArcCO_0453 [Halalkaliarchaeum sp. AArc-CO]